MNDTLDTLEDSMLVWQNLIDRGLVFACIIRPESTYSQCNTLVMFWVGLDLFGIPSHYIQTVQPLNTYVPLPFAHPCIAGVVTFENRLVTVLDVRPLMGQQQTVPTIDTPTLIVRLQTMDIALLTDGVIPDPSLHAPMKFHCTKIPIGML